MSEYPTDYLEQEECHWGPTVLVRVPPSSIYPHDNTYFVAHLEADTWLARDSGDPAICGDLHAPPEAWMPIEGVSLDP